MKIVALVLAGLLAACGGASAATPEHLQALTKDDTAPPAPGDLCFFATEDQSQAPIRLVARGDRATVRVDGKPRSLKYLGLNLRGGGTFRDGPLTVTISGVSPEAARSITPIGESVRVRVQDDGVDEAFDALWTC